MLENKIKVKKFDIFSFIIVILAFCLDRLSKTHVISLIEKNQSEIFINDYLNTFENKIYGITGDPKKVFLFSKSWGIISEKIFTEEGEYLINHSSSIILLRNGKFLSRISHHANYEKIFSTINKYL